MRVFVYWSWKKDREAVTVASVGKNIRALRKAKGITQETFAERLHVTRQAVSNWETRRTEPDLDTLQAVAAALETEFTEIVYGPGHIMNAELERYVRFQKKKVIVFAAAALLVVGLILRATLVHDLDMARKRTFDMTPYYIASTSVRSVIFFCLIASIPTGIALFSDIHIGNQRLRQALLGTGVALLVLHVLVCAEPFLSACVISSGGELGWPFNRYWWAVFVYNVCAQYAPLAFVRGALTSLGWN